MQQSVEERGGDDRIAEDLAPFREAAVGGEDHRTFLVAGVDELEEQVAAARSERQVPDLVDDEQRKAAEVPDPLAQYALAFGLRERSNYIGERPEVDAATGLYCLDAERQAEMRLARAGWANKVDGLGAVYELQLGEGHDAVLVKRGLEGEVEAGQCFDRGQPGHLQSHFDAPVLTQRQFLCEKDVHRFQRRGFAALDAAQGDVEDFERARHSQADEIALDAIDDGRRGAGWFVGSDRRGHSDPPRARPRPT